MMSRPLRILCAEDNLDDFELLCAAVQRASLPVVMDHVEHGLACMQYLRRHGEYANVPRPDLLLLDLNMPRMSGFEVMEEIVRDDSLRSLPVIVLSTSAAPEDIERMYRLRCSSYIRKPLELQDLLRVVQTMLDYWATVVMLPSR